MPRPEHKFLVAAILVLVLASPLWAFYDGDNRPAGQPPNYTPIDSSYFMGAPRFADYSSRQVGGYYIFKDSETGRWNVIGLVWPGGTLYEQMHGSVLVQMDRQPQEGINVWPIGFHHSDNLYKNDRWGWVKWPEAIAPNLYEVWWDVTIDVARLGNPSDPFDSVGIAFTGCAFDFNIWATGHFSAFTAQQVKVGKDMTPITSVPGFVDTYAGLSDPYQGSSTPKEPNTSNFTLMDLPGATYGPDSVIPADDTYGGARAYEGNGVEFSVSACPPPGDNPPVFEPPLGYGKDLTICLGSSITDTVRAVDPDEGDILTMEILSGPGTLASAPGLSPLFGYLTWTPTVAGDFTIVYKVTDSHGLFAIDSVKYTITLNHPPMVQATDTTIASCEMGNPICRTVTASDPENDPLTFRLLDGIGNIDPSTGEVCFTPEQPGEYGFLVAAADSCGADTVSFTIAIEGNNPPHINPYDSVVVLCAADTICFDVTASDPDAGDSLAIVLLDGPGQFVQTGNGFGRQCFLPADADSARYVFRYGVTDDCLRQGWLNKTVPPMPTDSIVIIVIANRPPTIACPEIQDRRLCAPEMVCYTFDAVNAGDDALAWSLLYGTGTIDPATGKLCFYAEASGQYRFIVKAANECGADTCTAVFNVTVDSPPMVSLPDSTVRLCQVEEICLPLTFSDPDDDIVSITVQSQKYTVVNGEVCFVPDGPGRHEIIVTVTDSCGNKASDTSHVDVILNTAPQATAPADTTVMQCAPAEVCLTGFGVFDPDGNLASMAIMPNIGWLDDSTYCFMPDTSGYYCLVIQATDSCGAIATDTIYMTVRRGASPAITCPEPQTATLCVADSICVPVSVAPADAGVTILEQGAVYRDGKVCFYAAEDGLYRYTVVAANECGADTCTVEVNVTVGIPPVISCPDTQTKHLCGPDSITVPVTVSPANAIVRVLPAGVYKDGQVTFYAGTEGTQCLTVIAETDCGADTCEVCVDVTFDRPPQVIIPDSTIKLCAPVEICLPAAISDPDDNIAGITVQPEWAGINDGTVCFTPQEQGSYDIIITVTDSCGNVAADTAHVDVTLNMPPQVSIPDTMLLSCRPQEVCLPVMASDLDGAIVSIVATAPAVYNAETHTVCLPVTASGQYPVTVTVTDDCGATAQATATITVPENIPPSVSIPDTSVFICGPTEVCLPVTATDADGSITSITADLPAVYNPDAGTVCLTVSESGEYRVSITVTDDCGASVSEDAVVLVTVNRPPQVSAPADTSVFQCETAEICLDGFITSDPDGNLAEVAITPNIGQLSDGRYCFTPDTIGTYRLVFSAVDSCGLTAVDTIIVTVARGAAPVVSCPEPQTAALCQADSICVPVGVTPAQAVVTILEPGAVYRDGNVCFYASESGSYRFTIVAANECGADTCLVDVDVTVGIPPIVTCPETQAKHLCGPDSITIPVTISPANAVVRVLPEGAYENGQVTFFAGTAGMRCLTVIAETDCGADTCDVCVDVTFDLPPVVSLPDSTVKLCEPAEICIPLTFSDPDDNIASITVEQPRYKFADGYVCFFADAAGVNQIIVTVTDSCGLSDVDTTTVTVEMNVPPTIEVRDTALFICGPTEVCLPVTAIDPDGIIDSIVVTPPAFYNEETHSVCMIVNKSGDYDLMAIAYDDCGVAVSSIATIHATSNQPPQVTAPADTAVFQCTPQEICLSDFVAIDPDGNLAGLTITPPLGTFSEGRYCFTPTAAGTYVLAVTASDSCGASAVDTVRVTVTLNLPPMVAVNDTSAFVCQLTEICLPVEVSDPDGSIDSVRVTPIGYYDAVKQMICVPVPDAGTYTITVRVYDNCGASASDQASVTVTMNRPPVVTIPPQTPQTLCELQQICIPVTVDDPDGNVGDVHGTTSCGGPIIYNPATNMICWTPTAFGQCNIQVIVTDGCGAADTAATTVVLKQGTLPEPICPRDTTVRICEPGEVCLNVGRLGHSVTIHPTYFNYDPTTGILCYNIPERRTDTVWVLDATDCGVDSCSFVIRTLLNQPPEVKGDPVEPTRFCDPFNLCFGVIISDPDNNIASVVVDGCYGASYDPATRKVCMPVGDDIDCTVRVTVTDSCGASGVWSTRVVMHRNNPPAISVPELKTIIRCETDTTAVIIPDFCVSDPDNDQVEMALDSGLGTLSFNPITNCAKLTFTPPTNDSAKYCFRVRANDICDTVFADYCLTILSTPVCSTCVTVSIVGPGCVSPGANATIVLKAETHNSIAGFDLLLAYDASAIIFLKADIGPAVSGWEYFTYRYGAEGNCEGSCPSGMLRIVAIADINNGPAHPPVEQLDPQGIIGSMSFRVMNNANLGGQNIPISFFWYDCADNSFSDPTGQYLLVDQSIYSAEGNIVWDEANDASFPESGRPDFLGAPDTCLTGGAKTVPVRCVTFRNGSLCIIHPDSIDARGDMNLNGISYEIADAVVYTNYFIIGLRAFSISVPGQIAASDINGDGLTLTVADLVYLVRVITGDAMPYVKGVVPGEPARLECITSGSSTRVTVKANDNIGAALMVFSYEGERPGDPILGPAASQMDMKFTWTDENTLRVLLYSFEAGHRIETDGELLEIPFSGNSGLLMKEADMADYYGRALATTMGNSALPRTMDLTQNRPNPFNPTTTFQLGLPTASSYTVEIYNISGQIIHSWSGSAPAGYVTFEWNGDDNNGQRVASGIYFYRARAAGTEAIRKMVLVK